MNNLIPSFLRPFREEPEPPKTQEEPEIKINFINTKILNNLDPVTNEVRKSSVYRVLVDGTILCMKRVNKNDKNLVKMIRNEIKIYDRLGKNNTIARVLAAWETKRKICLFMTAYDCSLFNLIEDYYDVGERCPVDVAEFVIKEVAIGLKHIHSRGVIHRDIKPDNILMFRGKDSEEIINVCIADFDKSVIMEDLDNYNVVVGTPGFTAPELLNRSNYSYEVDIFSLGMTLYQMVTNDFPFSNEQTFEEISNKILAGFKPEIIKIPGYEKLVTIYCRATEFDVSKRITLDEILEILG